MKVELSMPLMPVKENRAIGAELERLAERLGTELKDKVNLWNLGDEPIMEGQWQGFSYAVKLLSHGVGWPGLARVPSISLILYLLKGNRYHFEQHNTEGMAMIFRTPAEAKQLDAGITLEPSQVEEVLPSELRGFLNESGLDYFFTIQLDRIVMSTYRAYQHELYVFLLDQMVKAAQALARLA